MGIWAETVAQHFQQPFGEYAAFAPQKLCDPSHMQSCRLSDWLCMPTDALEYRDSADIDGKVAVERNSHIAKIFSQLHVGSSLPVLPLHGFTYARWDMHADAIGSKTLQLLNSSM